MSTSYRLKDKNLVGRQDGLFECDLFHAKKGWVPGMENLLMDRIIGYDGDEIGNTGAMELLEEISEEEARRIVSG